jgi:hypothetical protein
MNVNNNVNSSKNLSTSVDNCYTSQLGKKLDTDLDDDTTKEKSEICNQQNGPNYFIGSPRTIEKSRKIPKIANTSFIQNEPKKDSKETIYENVNMHMYDDEENKRIQIEAKELIEKTRRMMENLDDNIHKFHSSEIKNYSSANKNMKNPMVGIEKNENRKLQIQKSDTNNLSINNFPNFTTDSQFDYLEEKPFDIMKIMKIENPSNTAQNISYSPNSTSNTNLNTLNKKLLEKIKTIKFLEKEVKEKNSTIDKLNSKLDKQNEEIKKLNEKLTVKFLSLK